MLTEATMNYTATQIHLLFGSVDYMFTGLMRHFMG